MGTPPSSPRRTPATIPEAPPAASAAGQLALEFADWLTAEGAHHDLVSWVRGASEDVCLLWESCPRGDWLLAMAARLGATPAALTPAACAAARTAFELLPDGEGRPAAAVAAIETCAAGEAADSLEAHRKALEAMAAGAPDPTVNAVAEAVLAALASLEEPAAAAGAAALAAQAAVFDVGDCAMMPALRYAQEQSASAVRGHLGAAWAATAFGEVQGE